MWNYLEDLAALKVCKDKIDPKTYDYITDEKFYNPSCHESLHDAWLIKLNIMAENISDLLNGNFYPPKVILSLLGAYHDIIININYNEVRNYSLSGDNNLSDIISHKFLFNNNFIVHEVHFAQGKMLFEFKTIEIDIQKISNNTLLE